MLRITVEENPTKMTLKLEGRLAGPWVAELDRLWEQTASKREARNLSIDLRSTTFADTDGIRSLRNIYSETRAELLTGTPWTQYLAEEIQSTKVEKH